MGRCDPGSSPRRAGGRRHVRVSRRSSRQTVAALASASLDDGSAGAVRHAVTEAVLAGTPSFVRLVSTLHHNSKRSSAHHGRAVWIRHRRDALRTICAVPVGVTRSTGRRGDESDSSASPRPWWRYDPDSPDFVERDGRPGDPGPLNDMRSWHRPPTTRCSPTTACLVSFAPQDRCDYVRPLAPHPGSCPQNVDVAVDRFRWRRLRP